MRLKKHSSGYWHVRYFAGDRGTVAISTHCKDRVDALKVAADSRIKELELAARAKCLTQDAVNMILRGGAKQTMSFLNMEWGAWMAGVNMSPKTAKNKTSAVNTFVKLGGHGDKPPSEITDIDVSAFVNRGGTAVAGTRRISLSYLRSFFDWMRHNNYCSTNPARLARLQLQTLSHEQKEPVARQPFTDEEVACVLNQARARKDDFWVAAILIGRHTALRLGDICCLEWACVGEKMVVWTGKRGKRVELEISPELAEALSNVERDSDKYVFPHVRHLYVDPDLRPQISTQFRRLCDRCGVKKSFHSLRHSRAQEIFNQSGIEETRKQLGHSSTRTTEGYLK